MLDAGVSDGDEVIVDRGLEPRHGDIVVATVDGAFTIKRFLIHGKDHGSLHPENPDYPDLAIGPESDFQIWGVVTRCLHRLSR